MEKKPAAIVALAATLVLSVVFLAIASGAFAGGGGNVSAAQQVIPTAALDPTQAVSSPSAGASVPDATPCARGDDGEEGDWFNCQPAAAGTTVEHERDGHDDHEHQENDIEHEAEE